MFEHILPLGESGGTPGEGNAVWNCFDSLASEFPDGLRQVARRPPLPEGSFLAFDPPEEGVVFSVCQACFST